MQFAASLSCREDPDAIVAELLAGLARLPARPDLALLFASGLPAGVVESAAGRLLERLRPRVYLGCTAEGVVGAGQEVERAPAVSLLVGHLPGADLHPFRIGAGDWAALLQEPAALKARVRSLEPPVAFMLLADPFSTPVDELLEALHDQAPGVPVVGGMASGGGSPGVNRLFCQDAVDTEGLVGLAIGGNVSVRTVVSQGCRPIGPLLLVTEAEQNLILRLGDRPALEVLRQVVGELPPEDLRLVESAGLFVGLVIEERADLLGRGEVLIRGLVGADPESGAVAVADRVSAGQTLQLHVRDAASADAELRRLLAAQAGGPSPAAGLVFSCNGRGTRLFDAPGHDAAALGRAFPGLPAAGFFAMGELGSVGGRGFLHGHTASIALISPGAEPDRPPVP